MSDLLGTPRGYEGRRATGGRAGISPAGHVGGAPLEGNDTMITVVVVVLVVVVLAAFALNRDNTRMRL